MSPFIVYYTVQHKLIAKSPWGEPEGKLKKVKDDGWTFSSFDHFMEAVDPWSGSGHNYTPRRPASHADLVETRCLTGKYGWQNIRFAKIALKALRKLGTKGAWDSTDSYGKRMASRRHEFQLVKCRYHFSFEPVKED